VLQAQICKDQDQEQAQLCKTNSAEYYKLNAAKNRIKKSDYHELNAAKIMIFALTFLACPS
jgi:hypothetical protein